ncbi:MAG TPA: nuclear transport factor 2 family protein [Actinomycetota bacterium]
MHPNERLLRDADEAMQRGDNEAYLAVHTDDVIVHVAGKSSFGGTYKGKDQFTELFGRFMERTPEFTFEGHDYLVSDDHGVVLQRSHYKRGNETLDTDDVFVCHIKDGKVAEFWLASMDQDALDAFLG